MRMRLKQKSWLVLIMILAQQWAYAEPSALIVEMIEQSEPDQQAIAEAKKKLDELKSIELKGDFKPLPFHKRRENQIKATDQVYCNGCHLPLPHQKSLRTRAFMNMHTQYIACETCHFKPKGVALSYHWFDYANNSKAIDTVGRLHSGRDKKDITPLMERNGKLKIAPFFQNKAAIITRLDPFSKSLQERWKDADTDQKALIQATIHLPLQAKGTECEECHTKDADLLDLVALSDSHRQAESIKRNTIADFFKHYKLEKPLASGELPQPEQRIKITDLLN